MLSESTGKGLWAGGQTCPSLPSSGVHYWKRLLTFSLWGMETRRRFLLARCRPEMHHSLPQAADVSAQGKGWAGTKPSASRPGDALPCSPPRKEPCCGRGCLAESSRALGILLFLVARLLGLPGLGDPVITKLSGVSRKTKHIPALPFQHGPSRDYFAIQSVQSVSMLSPSQMSHGPGPPRNLASPVLDGEAPVCSPHLSQTWEMYAGIAAGQTGTIFGKSCQHITETGSSMLKRAPEQGPWPTGSEADSGKHSLTPSSAVELGPSGSPPAAPRFPPMEPRENEQT